jgi:hypothetical protein
MSAGTYLTTWLRCAEGDVLLCLGGDTERGGSSEVGCTGGGCRALNLPCRGSTACFFVRETMLGLRCVMSGEFNVAEGGLLSHKVDDPGYD